MTILVLAEKPNQGKKYAEALEVNDTKETYIEGYSPVLQDKTIVTWAKGHLVALCDFKEYDSKYEKWNLQDYPFIPSKMKRKILPYTSRQFYAIKELIETNLNNMNDSIIIATDPEREGENIAYSILNFIPHVKNNNLTIQRLWANTQEPQELKKYFKNLKSSGETYPLFLEADARSIADNLIGFNFTVQLTLLLRKKNIDGLYTVGRVQTPTLFMVYEREKAIQSFKKEKYYTLTAYDEINKVSFSDKSKRKFTSKEEAILFLEQHSIQTNEPQPGIIEDISSEVKYKSAPSLLKLGGIQKLANRKWGYSLKRTLAIVQSLYDKGYVSYPRTDCTYITHAEFEYLNEDLSEYQKILDMDFNPVHREPRNKYVNDEKVLEHYAIIVTKLRPTPQTFSEFSIEQQNIYRAILEHSLAMFADDYKYNQTYVNLKVNDLLFTTSGQTIIENGWKDVISDNQKENQVLPQYEVNSIFNEENPLYIYINEKETQPPKRLTEASLGGEGGLMEKCGKMVDDENKKEHLSDGIGTPATRSQIVSSLIEKDYISVNKNKLYMTDKGNILCKALDNTAISSVEMTADWESYLKSISEKEGTREEFVEKTKNFILRFSEELPSYINNNISSEDLKKVNHDLGTCPVCGTHQIVKRKMKNGKTFYPCQSHSCDFVIWGEIAKRKISEQEVKELITNKKTSLLKGFKSKKGKSFDAFLKVEEDKVAFEFPNNNQKKGSDKN
ncbi:type IA DNA topoisomerase [Staphylococcus caprae]|uniref:type IA DNA topoisomerase n=1 Tax=Staphylococcus caprae TaxID=29380 RepID=UPI000CD26A98|nr:type IA DNA topoisomerase [Staphylococcus caprae]POA06090.1 type IA DNA topoisomerase [Staphylococcus caprae]SUL89821.1 DNA topoisomerase III topB [Staphylococcus caprae]